MVTATIAGMIMNWMVPLLVLTILAALTVCVHGMEQGAVGGFYDTRAFTAFAVPTGTPADIVKKLADLFVRAGDDAKVKQVLTNFLLGPPDTLEGISARFKRDSEVMLELLKGLGIKPE